MDWLLEPLLHHLLLEEASQAQGWGAGNEAEGGMRPLYAPRATGSVGRAGHGCGDPGQTGRGGVHTGKEHLLLTFPLVNPPTIQQILTGHVPFAGAVPGAVDRAVTQTPKVSA